jgi:threonine synthase
LCEPSSASVFSAYKKLIVEDKLNSSEKNLLLITGNGLKDFDGLRKKYG